MKLSCVALIAALFAAPAFGQTTAGLQSVITATPFLITDANCNNGYLYESADGTFTCDATFQYAGPGAWNYYDQNGNAWMQVSPYAANYYDQWGNDEFWFDTSDVVQQQPNPGPGSPGGGQPIQPGQPFQPSGPPQGAGGNLHIYDANNDDNIDFFGGYGNGFFAGGLTATTGIADTSLGASTSPICTGPMGVLTNVGCSVSAINLPSDIDYLDKTQTISGQKFFTSPIAIGTTSPQQALLDINGWVGNNFIELYNGYGQPQFNSLSNIVFSGPEAPNGFSAIVGGGDPCCWSGGAGALAFQTNNGGLTERMRITAGGAIGIGTQTPNSKLTVVGNGVWGGADFTLNNTGNGGQAWTIFSTNSSFGQGAGGLLFYRDSADGQGGTMMLSSNGNVGVGTTTPGADLTSLSSPPSSSTPILEVNGDIALSQHKGGQVIFSDGTVQTTAWNGTLHGGDYAESVDVLGDRKSYEPGDVITIDPNTGGRFSKSQGPYSRLVAGVFSTKPGLVGRRATTATLDKDAEVPMAIMGIVPTKVSTENGPIEPGDLLVTASVPGYAMKGTEANRLMGAVIGKALSPLLTGSGLIEVLISLQ